MLLSYGSVRFAIIITFTDIIMIMTRLQQQTEKHKKKKKTNIHYCALNCIDNIYTDFV